MPSLSRSMATKYVLDGKTLIPPFVAIPGLGGQAAAAIVAAREEGEFTSIDDFRKRTKLGKKVCETLKDEGVLEGLPEGTSSRCSRPGGCIPNDRPLGRRHALKVHLRLPAKPYLVTMARISIE